MNTVEILDEISSLLENNQTRPVVEYKDYDTLTDILDIDKKCDGEWDDILHWIKQYFQYSIDTTQTHFANRMWSGANLPSILGEIVVALTNTSSCTYESAPVASIMERYMIDTMLDLIGFENGTGQMTTGSSNANMISMMIARNRNNTTTKKDGLFNQARLYAFVNEDAHYSLDKAINILGIGTEQLVKIKTLSDGAIDTNDLEKAIDEVIQSGGIPFYVCATLGTTVRGGYDSITDLVKLREKHNFWLHGDGAWGGAALMSSRLKNKLLKDVEHLDSFTMDFHKMLGSSLMCNFLVVNHKGLLTKTCADGDNTYIFRDDNYDSGVSSLQCGRRVDSLKWFLDWKYYGQQGFSDRVENYYELAKFTEQSIIKRDSLEMVSDRTSFNLCFRFKTGESIDADAFMQALRDKLYQEQKALIALAHVNGHLIFRLLLSNTNITKESIEDLLDTIVDYGEKLLNE